VRWSRNSFFHPLRVRKGAAERKPYWNHGFFVWADFEYRMPNQAARVPTDTLLNVTKT
jgi:hypothetical protein